MRGGEIFLALLIVLCLFTLCFLGIILRHKRKMALIARGINPEEPSPLKTYRRGLVLLCIGIGAGLLAVANAGKNEAGFWVAVCVLFLAAGIAHLLFYRAAKKLANLPKNISITDSGVTLSGGGADIRVSEDEPPKPPPAQAAKSA